MRLTPCIVLMLSITRSAAAVPAPLRFVDESGAPVNVAWLPEGDVASLARPVGDDGILVRHDGEGTPQCVMRDGFVPVALTPARLEVGGDVVMRPGRTARGRILSASGAPIGGITLRVIGDDTTLGACARRATSDVAGRFFLHGLGPQDDLVEIVAPPGWLVPPKLRLARASGLEIVVKLHPTTTIKLTIAGADGKPLGGASSHILPEWKRYPLDPPAWKELRESVESWKGTSDATGRVALPLLPQRVIWRVVVEHPLHAPASVRAMAGRPSVDAKLTLTHGGRVELRAVDEEGVPLAGAAARIVPGQDDDYDLVPKSAASGKDGILRLARVPAGRVAVEITAPGMRPSVAHAVVVEDDKLASVGDVVLEPGVAIAGVVRSEGAPVEKATVVVRGHGVDGSVRCEVETAADGAFRCDGLDPELRAIVEAEADWHLSARTDHVIAGTTDLELVLERAGAILVSASDADTSDPVADPDARLHRDDPGASNPGPEVVEDAPASLRFMPVAPGTYEVEAWAPGYATRKEDAVEVVAGEETIVEIDLAHGRSVRGRVVEAGTGRAIASAHLSLPRAGVDATSGDDGGFTLDGVKGPFLLTAAHDSYPSVTTASIDPETLPPEGLVIEMTPGGSVEGVVVIITGDESAPMAGASIEAGSDNARRTATTDAEGHYRLDGLPPGPLQIVKTDRPGSLEGRETGRADIVAGQTVQVNFGVNGTLYGLVRVAGEPLAGAVLGLMERPDATTDGRDVFLAPSHATTSDVDGRYVLRGVGTGPHVLTISWAGRRISRDVVMPLTHRHVEFDVDIPELHVSGRVIAEATGEPVPGATVTLRRTGGEKRGGFTSMMSTNDEDGEDRILYMTTELTASDETGADGAFTVPLDAPGKYEVMAYGSGADLDWWTGEADVTTSRDDMVISLKPKAVPGRLRVHLVDGAAGTSLPGGVQIRLSNGGSETAAGAPDFAFELPEQGQTATLVAWAENRAPEVREGIVSDGEGDTELSIPMGPAGRLKLLAPEGSLPDAPDAASKLLHLKLASGFDLGAFLPNISLGNQRQLAPLAPGEWLVGPLPPGPLAVSIGDGPSHAVDVIAGDTVEVDLR